MLKANLSNCMKLMITSTWFNDAAVENAFYRIFDHADSVFSRWFESEIQEVLHPFTHGGSALDTQECKTSRSYRKITCQ